MSGRRKWNPGDQIGPWTLVARRGTVWEVRCKCGAIAHNAPANLRSLHLLGKLHGCASCASLRQIKPRICRSCGTKDPTKFGATTVECKACEKAASRNGRDAEGRALRLTARAGLGAQKVETRKRQKDHPAYVVVSDDLIRELGLLADEFTRSTGKKWTRGALTEYLLMKAMDLVRPTTPKPEVAAHGTT